MFAQCQLDGALHGPGYENADQGVGSCSARNNAAVRSRGSASARAAGLTPLFASAARSACSSYRTLRLFQIVLRFCPKLSLRNAMNSASSEMPSAAIFG